MTTTQTLAASPLTSATLRESLAAGRDEFKVGPLRKQGQYHGRVLFDFATPEIAAHAANILRTCDRYDVTVMDGARLAVIARKP